MVIENRNRLQRDCGHTPNAARHYLPAQADTTARGWLDWMISKASYQSKASVILRHKNMIPQYKLLFLINLQERYFDCNKT